MFLDNLSAALLRFCAARSLSYEEVAERCRISPRCFGEIVRKHTSPPAHAGEDLRRAGRDAQRPSAPQGELGRPCGGPGRRPKPRRRRPCAAA